MAQPDQFFHRRCPGQGEGVHILHRPMSIYAARLDCIEFLHKILGGETRGLAALAPQDRFNLVEPPGHGFHPNDDIEIRHVCYGAMRSIRYGRWLGDPARLRDRGSND